ncbi:MAG: indole-3-glycerol phosphate synthase TrpC [Candidatus Levybacteria bacterium]|nr:indole-3-glycerol phosphate synthase TrpC [Candidatus Levybacteria bacterium]
MHNFLSEIIKKKREDITKQKKTVSIVVLKKQINVLKSTNGFKNKLLSSNFLIIAEIKLASPTMVFLGSKDNVLERAIAYKNAGAQALSVITEKHFFKGDIGFISLIKNKIQLPILQKDFIIDEYQIYQAKENGSDALLFIAKLVDEKTLKEFIVLSQKLGVEPVVEINDEDDFKKAIKTNASIIAVNARDLETFKVDVDKACDLMKKIPDKFIKLGFSGISSSAEVEKYRKAGAKGVLVGTALMKAENIEEVMRSLKI